MEQQGAKARILLFGLDEVLGSELRSVLADQDQAVYSEPFQNPPECLGLVENIGADLIFCSSNRERYLALIEALSQYKTEVPVVVVSRTPEVSEWLDAIEAGASDYCAAPFESGQVQWILESALKHSPSSVLYRATG